MMDSGQVAAGKARALTQYELWYGRNEPPPQRTLLRAGSITGVLEGGDLRDVRLGGIELVRRIYVAVRDENWDTIPAQLTDLSTDVRDDRFVVSYDAEHHYSQTPFPLACQDYRESRTEPSLTRWQATPYKTSPIAGSDFACCIPSAEYCGRPYRGNGPNGQVTGNLPTLIAPQRFEDGFYMPLFPSVSDLSVSLKSGIDIRFAFEGDLFEMEDQRNWTDGSFKTYCTPLSLGYPFKARAGQEFTQRVTLAVEHCPAGKASIVIPRFSSILALRSAGRCRASDWAWHRMRGTFRPATRTCSAGCASIICASTCT